MKFVSLLSLIIGFIGGLILFGLGYDLEGLLFFIGAALSALSVYGYAEICKAILGEEGSIIIGAILVLGKLCLLVLFIVEIAVLGAQSVIWLVLGLFSFLPAVLIRNGKVSTGEEAKNAN
jgi:hypothetical protein